METRFGHDFSGVRVHNDREATLTAAALGARAFTLGRHIAFSSGQYEPGTSSGRELLAHELTHVVQQAQNPSPILRRAPALKGHSTNDLVGESIAADVDKAVAESKTIAKFIAVKDSKKEKGNMDLEDPVVFASRYKKSGNTGNVDDVPGFVDRASNDTHPTQNTRQE